MAALTLKQMIIDLESCGLTQKKIGEVTGIAQGSISKLKNDQQTSVFHHKADALFAMHQWYCVTNKKAQSVA